MYIRRYVSSVHPFALRKRGIHAKVLLQERRPSNAVRTTCLADLICLGEGLDRLFMWGQEVSTDESGSVLQQCHRSRR